MYKHMHTHLSLSLSLSVSMYPHTHTHTHTLVSMLPRSHISKVSIDKSPITEDKRALSHRQRDRICRQKSPKEPYHRGQKSPITEEYISKVSIQHVGQALLVQIFKYSNCTPHTIQILAKRSQYKYSNCTRHTHSLSTHTYTLLTTHTLSLDTHIHTLDTYTLSLDTHTLSFDTHTLKLYLRPEFKTGI